MKIQWLGHSSFKLEESTGTSIVTDPFEESVDFRARSGALSTRHAHAGRKKR